MTAGRLSLSLVATDVSEVFAVAFDLEYPITQLRYDGVSEGDFLADGGSFTTSLQSAENPEGRLVVGLTRLGAVDARSGSGELLTLEFSAVGDGNGVFSFANNDTFDAAGDPQPDVTWSAGAVEVNL